MIRSPARLDVDFGELVGEFAYRRSDASGRIHGKTGDLVGNAAKEQIPSLAADVRDGEYRAGRQLLLNGRRILQYLLGNRIAGGVGARLKLQIRIVDSVVGVEKRGDF